MMPGPHRDAMLVEVTGDQFVGIPPMMNDSTLAFSCAVPIGLSPRTPSRACVAYSSSECS